MNSVTWPYLAGFLDGDGWITCSKNKNCETKRYVVGFCQEAKHEAAIMALAAFMRADGILVSVVQRVSRVRADQREVAMLDLHVKAQPSVLRLLSRIEPFLILKGALALEAMTYTAARLRRRGVGAIEAPSRCGRWTEDELRAMRTLHATGYTNPAIAKSLGRSDDAVGHKLHRLGLTRRCKPGPCHGDVLAEMADA